MKWNVKLTSWNHNHISELISQLVILLLQSCPFQCFFRDLQISRTVYDRKYPVHCPRHVIQEYCTSIHELGRLQKYASKSCLIRVFSNAKVPTSSLNPCLQLLNLSGIDSNLRQPGKDCGNVFLTQLLRSIRRVRLGQESSNISTADIVSSGCSLPLWGK